MMQKSTPQVALIIETSLAYGRGVLRGISRYVKTQSHWSIYFDQRSLNDPPPSWLKDWNGHGVIMRAHTKRLVQMVSDLRVPAVDALHQFQGLNTPQVIPDHKAVAQAAADHLLERHFQHFAFVGVERAFWSKARRDALIEILRKAGFACHVYSPISRRRFLASWDGGQEDLVEWLSSLPKPIGVVAAHDLRAMCVLDACRRRPGLSVPEQVAVIGVDNDEPLCILGDPPLSSVVLDHERIGFQAAELLDRMMQGKKPLKKPITVKPRGVITRRSTDVVAIEDQLVAKAVRYIHEHACDGVSVEEVATHCGVSRRSIERSFTQFLNMSPHEQILRTKVARAQHLLSETDFPLDTVAAKSGLSHAAYLNVLFKKQFGQTPGEYRRAERPDRTSRRCVAARRLSP